MGLYPTGYGLAEVCRTTERSRCLPKGLFGKLGVSSRRSYWPLWPVPTMAEDKRHYRRTLSPENGEYTLNAARHARIAASTFLLDV